MPTQREGDDNGAPTTSTPFHFASRGESSRILVHHANKSQRERRPRASRRANPRLTRGPSRGLRKAREPLHYHGVKALPRGQWRRRKMPACHELAGEKGPRAAPARPPPGSPPQHRAASNICTTSRAASIAKHRRHRRWHHLSCISVALHEPRHSRANGRSGELQQVAPLLARPTFTCGNRLAIAAVRHSAYRSTPITSRSSARPRQTSVGILWR
jgi:hypothetical protein